MHDNVTHVGQVGKGHVTDIDTALLGREAMGQTPAILIGVTDIPEAASLSAAEVLPEMLQGVRDEKGGVTVLRTGYTKVYGHEALWYFGTNSRVSAESTSFQRIIAVMAFVKGSVYTIVFRADSVLSEVNAEERMSRFQPLAMRMLSVMTLD